jgi:GntR family transcriptional regulator/MocR family aminotransferase
MAVTPVPVDDQGLNVKAGQRIAPGAALAVVTPGQQAPLGMTMALDRRIALLGWAGRNDAWIVEDDYLSELHLTGRAAPALASLDRDGRVVHIGSFSKTISPSLRLGFLVAPPALAQRFGDVAASLAPAANEGTQHAVAAFMSQGHYLRHLRRMKRVYSARRDALVAALVPRLGPGMSIEATGSLAVRLILPAGMNDAAIARHGPGLGIAPVPLSPWYAASPPRSGLMLAVTNLVPDRIEGYCDRLFELVGRHG